MWNLYRTSGFSLYPKVKNDSIVVLNGTRNNIQKVKEGTIIAVETDKSTIAHIYLGTITNGNNKKYVVTAPFNYPKMDSLSSVQKFRGIISYVLEHNAKANKIKVVIMPFLLLAVRCLLSLSYFICGFIYSIILFNRAKVKYLGNALVSDLGKWVKIWVSYIIRRL